MFIHFRSTGFPKPRCLAAAAGLLTAQIGPAWAHGEGPVFPADAWTHWSFDPLVLAPLLLAHWLYGFGLADLRRRLGRTAPLLPTWRVAAFLGGEAALATALVSPLDELSGTLLTAHMIQHGLLIAIAPILLVLGRPEIACFRGLPRRWRRSLGRSDVARRVFPGLRAVSRPLPAAALHGLMLWVWHAPFLFEAARGSPGLHWLEHLCFFGTALLFWRGLLAASGDRAGSAIASLAALATLVHSGFLGALLTLSPGVLYPVSTQWSLVWALTPLQDQQIAGVIMWAPMGAIYLAAGLALAARMLDSSKKVALLRPPLAKNRPKPSF